MQIKNVIIIGKSPLFPTALCIFLFLFNSGSLGKISEQELSKYSSLFIQKIIDDNPEAEDEIRLYMGGYIREGMAGIRLIDKFGLFLINSREKKVSVEKIRFNSSKPHLFSLFIVMRDDKDEQLYTMYVEYEYHQKDKRCQLRDIYFSIVFNDRMKEIKEFFESR